MFFLSRMQCRFCLLLGSLSDKACDRQEILPETIGLGHEFLK